MQAVPHGSPSAWSPQAGSGRSWAPRWPPPAIAWSPPPASRAHRSTGPRHCCPDVPLVPPDEAATGADLVLLAVPDDVLARSRPRPRGRRVLPARPDRRAHLRCAGGRGARPRRRARRAAAGPAPGDDVHGPGRGRRAARRCSVGVTATAGDEAALERRGGARRRDGRRAGPRARGGPPALPRGARPRREPPDHAGARLRRHPGAGRRRIPPSGWSRRCCRPRWTTRCATATARSPGRSPAATPGPCAPTCGSSAPSTPTWPRPTGSWPPAPPTGPSGGPAARSCRRRGACDARRGEGGLTW